MEQPTRRLRPLPPAPPLMGDPPPSYPGGLHSAVADIHELLGGWNDFLSTFSPRYITDADGNRVEVLARTRYTGDPPSEWFAISNISTRGTFKIRINEGRIISPNPTGAADATPSITAFLRELTVEAKESAVVDGDKVWVKITATEIAVANDYDGADTDEYVSVTFKPRSKIWHATAGLIVVQTATPTPSASEGWVLLGEITITAGVLKITPRHRGAIFAPVFTAPYSADPVITTGFSTATYTICDSGSAVDVEFVIVPSTP